MLIRSVVTPIAVIAVFAAAGCRTTPEKPPPPPAAPAVATSVTYVPAAPLAPAPGQNAAAPALEDAQRVTVTLFALASLPETALESIAPYARLVLTPDGGVPILASPRLIRGARVAFVRDGASFEPRLENGDFGPSTRSAALEGALAPGVTVVLQAISTATQRDPELGDPILARVAIHVHRPPVTAGATGAIEIALVLEGVAPILEDDLGEDKEPAGGEGDATEEVRPIFQREAVLLAPPPDAAANEIVLAFPSPFDGGTLAAVLQVRPVPAVGPEREAHEVCLRALREQLGAPAAPRPARPDAELAAWAGLASAFKGLALPRNQRSALVYLAGATGARLAEDVALSASDGVVAALAAALVTSLGEARNPAALGWLIERTAYRRLAAMMEEKTISPDLEGLLARHAGEVGRRPSFIEELLDQAGGLQDFPRLLADANRLYLEDTSPAARVRAFDWLAARREPLPPDYDPLDDVKKRRAALEQKTAAGSEGVAP